MALQHFEPTYKAFVKDISAQKAVNFLSESYSKSAPLRGFKKQANILAKQFAAAKAAVGEIVIQPWGFSGIANNKPLSRGTITLNTTHPEVYPIVQWNTFRIQLTRTSWCSSPSKTGSTGRARSSQATLQSSRGKSRTAAPDRRGDHSGWH